MIQQILGEANRYVNETSPIVDARLADGSRVNVVLKPVAVNGPVSYTHLDVYKRQHSSRVVKATGKNQKSIVSELY